MTGGIVIGGWEYVWAAYGITFVALAAYGINLGIRLRGERRSEKEENR